jgi:hypothetical protein
MKSGKPKISTKRSPHRGISKALAWAKANTKEWDFSEVEPKERAMAVAWEYGREYFEQFLSFGPFLWLRDKKRCKKNKKPFHAVHSHGLSQIFLTFWKSPLWPKKPFLDLSPSEKKHAFPKLFYEEAKTTSAELLGIVKDVTPYKPYERDAWKDFHKTFHGYYAVEGDYLNPWKRVFLVDMDQGPGAILKSFRDHLYRAGFRQGRGRSTIEKDLLALTVHRLYPWFKSFKAMDHVLGTSHSNNASTLATEHVRTAYWNYAQGRLGKGWGRKGGKSKNAKPIFEFSWVE